MQRLSLLVLMTCLGCGNSGPGGGYGDAQERIRGFLQAERYTRLVAEVDYIRGHGPEDGASEDVIAQVEPLVHKPDGVEVDIDDAIPSKGADHVWTSRQIEELFVRYTDPLSRSDTIRMHTIFVDGNYEADTDRVKILGIAWGYRNIVLFKDTLLGACQTSPPDPSLCRTIESSVWIHEVGHLFGLVDNGTPMVRDHKDEAHGAHCDRTSCVMYWTQADTSIAQAVRQRLSMGLRGPMRFDQDCLDDLEQMRNR